MRNPLRLCVWVAVVLWILGAGMCYFGIEHEIARIPPDVRAGMTDTDWVGAKWAFRAMYLYVLGLVLVVLGLSARLYQRRRGRG